jgi:hypothetical protein
MSKFDFLEEIFKKPILKSVKNTSFKFRTENAAKIISWKKLENKFLGKSDFLGHLFGHFTQL